MNSRKVGLQGMGDATVQEGLGALARLALLSPCRPVRSTCCAAYRKLALKWHPVSFPPPTGLPKAAHARTLPCATRLSALPHSCNL